jgi:brefeldin A-inhibited guanine nucleotide-exchange protein
MGQVCFHQFLQKNIGKLSESYAWDVILLNLEEVFNVTNPIELLNCDDGEAPTPIATPLGTEKSAEGLNSSTMASIGDLVASTSNTLQAVIAEGTKSAKILGPSLTLDELDFEKTIIKCVTHIEVLHSVKELCLTQLIESASEPPSTTTPQIGTIPTPSSLIPTVHTSLKSIPIPYLTRILNCVYTSYTIARSFNANHSLRQRIYRKGLVQQMPNLAKQETISMTVYIRLLFSAYKVHGDLQEEKDEGANLAERLGGALTDVLERFVLFLVDPGLNARDVTLWAPVVVCIFRELVGMDSWWGRGTRVVRNPSVPHVPTFADGRSRSFISESEDGLKEEDLEGGIVNGFGHGGGSGLIVGTVRLEPCKPCLVLKRQLPRFFRLGIRLMSVERADVRLALQEFMERVGDLLIEKLN